MSMTLLELNKKSLENLMKEREIDSIDYFIHDFLPIYNYDAISLEGMNKIPYEKVKYFFELNKIPDYSEREVKELSNHKKAFELIIKWTKEKNDLTEEDIKDLHSVLADEIYIGGVYRNVNIQIFKAAHQPPDFIKVYDRMRKVFEYLKENDLSYFDKGIYLNASLAKIHPFLDSNGKLGRLILNFYLMKDNYLPISINVTEREEYFKAIEEFKINKDLKSIKEFIVRKLNERYEKLITKLDV